MSSLFSAANAPEIAEQKSDPEHRQRPGRNSGPYRLHFFGDKIPGRFQMSFRVVLDIKHDLHGITPKVRDVLDQRVAGLGERVVWHRVKRIVPFSKFKWQTLCQSWAAT